MPTPQQFDAAIAGAGIVGLSLALELHQRGLRVAVVVRGEAMRAASWAAGGMLAALDPENPLALRPLSLASLALYPEYLACIEQLSGMAVPLRTRRTLQLAHSSHEGITATQREMCQLIPGMQSTADRFVFLEEDSLDPRDLCRALPAAARAAGISLLEETTVLRVLADGDALTIQTTQGSLHAAHFINCAGAWSATLSTALSVTPAKGQAVALALPADRLRCVLRTPSLYLIPRGDGRVVLGATVEHVGFDASVHPASIQNLIDAAATLLPEIAHTRQIESWAGFRPATQDGLPIIGRDATPKCWIATGHFRNGILLAPATARALAQAILGEPNGIPLEDFSLSRFAVAAM